MYDIIHKKEGVYQIVFEKKAATGLARNRARSGAY